MKAGIGAGIWVEHANILPLPHLLLAYRWHVVRWHEVRTTQDEELAVTQRPPGLPSREQVTELLADEFTRGLGGHLLLRLQFGLLLTVLRVSIIRGSAGYSSEAEARQEISNRTLHGSGANITTCSSA